MQAQAALWLVPVLAVPCLLAMLVLLPALRGRALDALWLAPLPALWAALAAPAQGLAFEAPVLLLDTRLALDGAMRTMLGFAALVWLLAGAFARTHLRDDPRPARFAALWLLTLTGSLGVIIAADVATFYTAFACLSLAAYPLVVHTRTEAARRAGTVYIVLAVLGEACLLAGFVLAAVGAESLAIGDVRAALADGTWRTPALALLVAGFGIKMGLVPLHVWLPLAHPAAPTAASAVLSGVLVKAGVVGLMQFLPEAAMPQGQALLAWAGIAGAYWGVVMGLCQRDPKTVLAYSTVSQMGLLLVLLALLPGHHARAEALDTVILYGVHHGLAKAALFLGVGVLLAAGGGLGGRVLLAVLGVPALSIAGASLTAGAVAKADAKALLGDATLATPFALSALGTALLMARFLWVLRERMRDAAAEAASGQAPNGQVPAAGLLLPWALAIVAALALPWWLATSNRAVNPGYLLQPATLWDGAWPVAAALAIGWAALRAGMRVPAVPEGDLLAPLLAAAHRVRAAAGVWASAWSRTALRRPPRLGVAPWRRCLVAVERGLARWSVAGTLLLLVALAVAR